MTTKAEALALFAAIDTETTRIADVLIARDAKIKELLDRIATGGGGMTAEEEAELFGPDAAGPRVLEKLKGIAKDPTDPVPNPEPEPEPAPEPEPEPSPEPETEG